MSKVIVEKSGPVKTVWMNRPEKRNALDSELLGNMIEALQAPVAAEDRVLVIRGKGEVFCAGLADEQHLALVVGDLVDAELPGQACRGLGRQWFPGLVEAQPDCHGYLPLLNSR